MTIDGLIDTDYAKSQYPYGNKPNFGFLKYGLGVETEKESLFSSATAPFSLHDILKEKTFYFIVPDSYGDTSAISPMIPWVINNESSKTLIYQEQLHPSDDLAWIPSEKAVQTKMDIQYYQVFNRVVQLFELSEDWDSYGGKVIERRCIDSAVKFLKYLIELQDRIGISVPVPFVSPLSSGGIQIEWEEKERYLELNFLPESPEIEYFVSDRTNAGELSLEGLMKSIKNFDELLLWFIRGKAEDLGSLVFENFYSES
jgi:hypothetical protein